VGGASTFGIQLALALSLDWRLVGRGEGSNAISLREVDMNWPLMNSEMTHMILNEMICFLYYQGIPQGHFSY